MLVDLGLGVNGISKLFLHSFRDALSSFQVFLKVTAGNHQMASKILLEVIVLGVCKVDRLSHLVTIFNVLLVDLATAVLGFKFFLPSGNILLGILPRGKIGVLGHFEVVTKDVVLVLDVFVVEILAIPLAVVDIKHPFFHGSHLCLLLVGFLKGDHTRFRLDLFRDFRVTKSKVVPLELLHVCVLDVLPGEIKVAIPSVLVSFADHELGIPVLENDRGIGVVLDCCQNQIGNVESHVIL
mmetsp:Transcript_5238/g.12476  ORF Transcript_5238/g.12476 Transcript_5238/m.12476 type:complete len:239 (+) Transcript_5238:206-922(+)